MPKTTFINGDASQGTRGTRVTAEYLNAVNNHHHTGLDQDGDGALPYAADTGTANAYVVALSPALTQHITGMPIYFKAANANTGASTINVNGLGTKTIKKFNDQELISGDIQAGQAVGVIYDGTNFQLCSSPSKLATLDTSSLVVQEPASKAQANGVASLDANSRVVQTANALWDGTVGRSASPTPVGNTIPVRDANSNLTKLDVISNNYYANNGTNSIDMGTVRAGDVIMAIYSVSPTSSSGTTAVTAYIVKSGGTATVKYHNGYTPGVGNGIPGVSHYWETATTGPNGQPLTAIAMLEVTANGTLTIGRTLSAYGSAPTYNYEGMTAFFLKKQ